MNYKVEYLGLREGYNILKTSETADGYFVFETFTAAKNQAIANAKDDVYSVREALKSTKAIKKSEVGVM